MRLALILSLLFSLSAIALAGEQISSGNTAVQTHDLLTYTNAPYGFSITYPKDDFSLILKQPISKESLGYHADGGCYGEDCHYYALSTGDGEILFLAANKADQFSVIISFIQEPSRRYMETSTEKIKIGGRKSFRDILTPDSMYTGRLDVPGFLCEEDRTTIPYRKGEILIDATKCLIVADYQHSANLVYFTAQEKTIIHDTLKRFKFH